MTRPTPWPPVARLSAVVALAMLLAACSGDSGSSATTATSIAATADPSDTAGATSTADSTPSSATSTPVTTSAVDTAPVATEPVATEPDAGTSTVAPDQPAADVDAAVVIWQEALTDMANGGDAADLLGPAAAAEVGNISQLLTTSLTFSTSATPSGDGAVDVEECVLSALPEATVSMHLRGRVEPIDGGLRVTSFADSDFGRCVPADLAVAAIAGYENFWDAFIDAGGDPSADHPRIDRTTTGNYNGLTTELLRGLADLDRRLQGSVDPRPDVIQYVSTDEIVVGDCQVAPETFGVYDAATGQRTEEIPAPVPGQTDYHQATMKFERGRWKVSELVGNLNDGCESPVADAVTVVAVSP